MISEELVVDHLARLCVPQGGNGDPRRAGGVGDGVELVQPAHPPVGSRHVVSFRAERPAFAVHLLEGVPKSNVRRELLEHAKQHRAVRPRAGDRAIEMVAAGLGRKAGGAVRGDAVPEDRGALEVDTLLVVLAQDLAGHPLAVDELAHAVLPLGGGV